MSGDKAQGLVWEVKSCSSVGSMYLGNQRDWRGKSLMSIRFERSSEMIHALHELERSTGTPWQGQWAFEYVSK